MGNYMSCTRAKPPGSGKCARVILPDGGVRRVPLPATAAELMMDLPGHFLFLVDARPGPTLSIALPADVDLELGAVYAAFPMKRAGTPLSAADVARLAAAVANRGARRSSSSAKVASAVVVASPPPVEEAPRMRLHRRRWRPRLETIEEENYMASRYVVC